MLYLFLGVILSLTACTLMLCRIPCVYFAEEDRTLTGYTRALNVDLPRMTRRSMDMEHLGSAIEFV